jgi:RecB family exonuclease
VATTRALGNAPWSASKIGTALRCPRLFHYKYVEKRPEPEVMPEARIGKAVHAALEAALGGRALAEAVEEGRKLLPDPVEQARFEHLSGGIAPFLARLAEFRRRRRVARELVEYTMAVRVDFTPTSFYSGDAFYRGIIDSGFLYDDGTLAVVDHKTGYRSRHLAITDQLEGYAVLGAAGFRWIRRIWLGIHWVANGEVDWGRALSIREIQEDLVPRVLANIEAAALAIDDGPRSNAGVWCERCNYRSVCPTGIEFRFEPVEPDEPEIE